MGEHHWLRSRSAQTRSLPTTIQTKSVLEGWLCLWCQSRQASLRGIVLSFPSILLLSCYGSLCDFAGSARRNVEFVKGWGRDECRTQVLGGPTGKFLREGIVCQVLPKSQ